MSMHEIYSSILDELRQTIEQVSEESCERLADQILSAKRVFVAGAGRSGLVARALAMRLMHLGLISYVVGEVVTPSIAANDLLLIASGSGETGSLVSMAKRARELGCSLALVSIFPLSTIGLMADCVVSIPAPTPKGDDNGLRSVQPMGTLFEQSLLLVLDGLIVRLMEKRSVNAGTMFALHANLE